MSQVFCRWGRQIYCNETIFPDVYNYFRNNRRRLFVLPEYSEDPGGVARQTMVEIYEEFSDGPRSTLCAFPPIFPNEERSFVGGVLEDCLTGDADDASLIERGGQLMQDVRQGIRDAWESL